MKPVRHLSKLERTCNRRLDKIHAVAAHSVSLYTATKDKELAWATVELLNLWSEFSRAYYLSCFRSARLGSGARITCSSGANWSTFDQLIIALSQSLGNKKAAGSKKLPRRNEPKWHQPNVLITGCTNLGTSHLLQVQSALSISSSVFNDLPTCRNFYGHRNEETAAKVLRLGSAYSIYGRNHPSEVLASYAYGRPQSLILDFVDDIRNVIQLLCT
jgi:hypothetical protein